MQRIAFAAATLLMLAGIAAGTLQSTSTPSVPQQPTVVLSDGTAPPPLCDPTYTKCKWSTNVQGSAVK